MTHNNALQGTFDPPRILAIARPHVASNAPERRRYIKSGISGMYRLLSLVLFATLPICSNAVVFDATAENAQIFSVFEGEASDFSLSCRFEFDEIRFDNSYGPGIVLKFEDNSASNYLKFRITVSDDKEVYLFDYLQGYEEQENDREIRYLLAPYTEKPFGIEVHYSLNGYLFYRSIVEESYMSEGYVYHPYLRPENINLTVSSSKGSQKCEMI